MERKELNFSDEKEIERLTQTIALIESENEKWRNKLISIISHEFKTPLSTIKLAATYLLKYRTMIEPEVINEKLKSILLQIDHLVYSVDNLRALKIEVDKMKISKHIIDIVSFFTNLKNDIERKFNNSHSIILDFDLVKNEMESDEDLLRNIFTNVLINAITFSPKSLTVWVKVKAKPGNIEITVKDAGLGIDSKDIPKIFDSFYRGNNSSGINGLGLGLSIVKKE